MPIKKIQVVHKFGILTEAHRNELTHTKESDVGSVSNKKATAKHLLSSTTNEEIVCQLNSEMSETHLLNLEDEAIKSLQKVKFQLSFLDFRNGFHNFTECWDTLCIFASCRRRRLQEFALHILHSSLCIAPLSRCLLPTVLDVCLTNMRTLLKEDLPNTWDRTYSSLSEVIFVACSRLYYHYLVQDLKELEDKKLEQLYFLNKAFIKTLIHHRGNPILSSTLGTITRMIDAICSEIGFRLTRETIETMKEDGKSMESNRSLNDLEISNALIHINKKENTDHDKCESSIEENETENSFDILAGGIDKERPPIASFLWNCLKLWKSISRQLDINQKFIDELYLADLSVDIQNEQWLDYILGFYTLCECSKFSINYLRIFMKLRPKTCARNQSAFSQMDRKGEIVKDDLKWNTDMLLCYLKCLSDVCIGGMTTCVQKRALLGNNESYGLIDYLFYLPSDPAFWKVRACVYQLVAKVYTFYQTNAMKDGLKNLAWDSMTRFSTHENEETVLNVMKNHELKKTSLFVLNDNVFSKIATNLSIMAFSPDQHCHKNLIRHLSSKGPSVTKRVKCLKRSGKLSEEHKTDCQSIHFKAKSCEDKMWCEVQRIVEDQFIKELKEDEKEKEILRQEMLAECCAEKEKVV